jgi:L-alanine-DL-glutamate epimerase-like enolase superfamily enzyme
MRRREVLQSSLLGLGAYNSFWRDAQAQGTSHAPKLKITAVRTAKFSKVSHSFVRIYTDQGVTGTAEFSDEIMAADIVDRLIGPTLVQEAWNPLDIEAINRRLWAGGGLVNGVPNGLPGHIAPVFIRGFGGPYLAAISGIDFALWDLAGKALGVPIYRLMGGRVRPKVPVYFDVGLQASAEAIRATGVRMIKGGIDNITRASTAKLAFDRTRYINFQVTNSQIDEVVDYVGKLRAAVGDANMAIEMHASYDVDSAIRIGRAIERFEPAWIEEPIPSDNPDAMAEVRRSVGVPVACGENIYTRYGFRPFFEKQAMAVAQPDMAKTGGLTEGRKIAAAAEVYGIAVAPHSQAGPYGIATVAHVCATIPNFFALEWNYFNKQYDEMLKRPAYKDGFLELSEEPGVGIELNQDFIKEYLLPGHEFPAA